MCSAIEIILCYYISDMIAVILVFIVAIFAIIYVNIPKCSNDGETCTTYRKCCGGLTCIEGKCKTTGGDASTCSTIGRKCVTNPCCSGLYCDPKTKTCLEDSCKTVFSPAVSLSDKTPDNLPWGLDPMAFVGSKRINPGESYRVNNLFCDKPQIRAAGAWGTIISDIEGCFADKECAGLAVSDESKDTCRFVDPTTLVFMDKTDTANCKLLFGYNKKE